MFSQEAIEATRVVCQWSKASLPLTAVAEALSRLSSVSTYSGGFCQVISEIKDGAAPGFVAERTNERGGLDGGLLQRVRRINEPQ